MVQLPAKVKNTIDNYLRALSRNDIPIKNMQEEIIRNGVI